MIEGLPLDVTELIAQYLGSKDLHRLCQCSSKYHLLFESVLWGNFRITNTLLEKDLALCPIDLRKLQHTSSIHFVGVSLAYQSNWKARKMMIRNCERLMMHCNPVVISVTNIQVEYVMPAFGKLNAVRELHLEAISNPLIFDDGFFTRICEEATHLIVLNLRYSAVTENALVHVPRLTSLKRLTLHTISQFCTISDPGIVAICDLVNLAKPEVYGTKLITDTGWRCMVKLKSLQHLCLSKSVLNDTGLTFICTLTSLEVLDISECNVNDQSLTLIASLQSLKKLDISHTYATDTSVEQFQKLRDLQVLYLSGTKITDLSVSYIATLPVIKVVNMNDTRVTGQGLISAISIECEDCLLPKLCHS